jgi:DNA-binding CsgD family transcriptional regulator
MAELSNSALSALIGTIYDCTLDPSQWDGTLARVAEILGCEKAILSLNDLRKDRILIKKSVGWEPFWLEERAKYLPEIHGAVGAWLRQRTSLDEPFVASREIPAHNIEASPYARECLSPQAIVDVAHLFLISTPTHFSELVLFWQEQHGVMTGREIELGALLLPHLRRAVTISNVLDIRTIESSRMNVALDALRQGVVFTNDRRAIVHANRSAEHMLRNGSLIGVVGGSLSVKSSAANDELSEAIALAAQDESTIGRVGTAIRLTELGQPPIFAHVLPMAGGDGRRQLQPDAVAAVFIDAPTDGETGADAFATAFGLTKAETRVLACLVAGLTLSETAAELDTALTTARTHLTHIFVKTGVSRQADLMRLMMQAARAGPIRRH